MTNRRASRPSPWWFFGPWLAAPVIFLLLAAAFGTF